MGFIVGESIPTRERWEGITADQVAQWFHEAYEQMAPAFGYQL